MFITCGSWSSCTGLHQHQAVQPVVGHPHQQLLVQRGRCPRSWLCHRLVTRPWRSFWTRHGGARGRRRRGKPWVSGEEHQEGGVQSCSPLTWWTSTRERESVKERVNDYSSDLAAGVNCQSVFVSRPLQKNLRVWNTIGIILVFTFLQTRSVCKTQTIPRPFLFRTS